MQRKVVWLAVLLLASAAFALAAARPGPSPINVTINGRPQHFASPPLEMNGAVLVPMREVFQALGATVSWSQPTQTVTAKNRETVSLQVGKREATVASRRVALSTPAQLSQGTVYVPLRFVSEALGATVAWNASARRVDIATASVPRVAGFRSQPSAVKKPAKTMQVVRVDLYEWGIRLTPRQVKAGPVRFDVHNTGTKTHALAVANVSGAVTKDIEKGKGAALTETLQPGSYSVFCPIDNHLGLGMQATLTVVK